MKSLITTAALSLLALSIIAEAQPQKNYTQVEVQLLASLPTQDFEFVTSAPKSSVTLQSLVASLPTFDAKIEAPALPVNTDRLMASLPTFDTNVEAPDLLVNVSKMMASLPTIDQNVEIPTARINVSKLMASLPTMDEFTLTSVLVDTDMKHLDTKNHQTATRLSEE